MTTLSAIDELKQLVEELTDSSQYIEAANLVARSFQIKMEVISTRFGSMPWDKDGQQRCIHTIRLASVRKKSYEFEFGQSIAQGKEEPTMYDILTCLTKYDPGSFEDFCGDFGYPNKREHGSIYDAVCDEYDAMCELFTEEELEVLSYIN